MRQKIVFGIIAVLLALTMLTTLVSALPVGPKTIEKSGDERWPTWGPINITAMAGNVSQLIFDASTVTQTYQGYYGNISGFIVLGDSNNNTLYDWTVASPQGEIYAVHNAIVPTWESVRCANQSELQSEDLRLGVNESIDEDAVNMTFVVGGAPDQIARFTNAELTHPAFYVANSSILANECPVAVMYNDSYQPSHYFKEVILSDSNNTPVTPGVTTEGFVIYTAIIAHTINPFGEAEGFNRGSLSSRTHDFEMIVGENGHPPDTGSTAQETMYWFYVELS